MNPIEQLHADIEFNYSNHAPTDDGLSLIGSVRSSAKAFAHLVAGNCPEGREKDEALTHIEQALMYGVASIVRTMTDDER